MHANCKRFFAPLVMAAFTLLGVASAKASSVVVGGTGLLTQGGVDQLATWLGEGDLKLTNVFTHALTPNGDSKTSYDFHTAADGKGRTFTVAEVTSVGVNVGGVPTTTKLIVGGYNPLSWFTAIPPADSYHFAANNTDRTAFLFNLSSPAFVLKEKLISSPSDLGLNQTRNESAYGPVFGGGADFYLDQSLNAGQTYNYSYGANGTGGQNIVDATSVSILTFDKLDVFTIANVAPLPSTALVGVVLLGGIVLLQARRRVAG